MLSSVALAAGRAVGCKASALRSPAMNSRRRISHVSEPLYGEQTIRATGSASCIRGEIPSILFAAREAGCGPTCHPAFHLRCPVVGVKPPSPRVTETAAVDPGCAKTPWRPLQLTHLLTEVAARKHPHTLSCRERRRLDAAERAYPVRGDAAAAVGGASRRPPGRLWLQPFLRALSRLGGAAVADDATEPRRRRAHVRRLRRHHARGNRRIDRRGEDGAAVHRHARRVELHLCRGHLDAGPLRLDRLAY